jgi:hypothetical protein
MSNHRLGLKDLSHKLLSSYVFSFINSLYLVMHVSRHLIRRTVNFIAHNLHTYKKVHFEQDLSQILEI